MRLALISEGPVIRQERSNALAAFMTPLFHIRPGMAVIGQDYSGGVGMIRDGFDDLLDRCRDELRAISPGS